MAMANMNLIGVFVSKLWSVQALACVVGVSGGEGGDIGATKNIIPPNFLNFRGYYHNTILQTGIQVPTAIYISYI